MVLPRNRSRPVPQPRSKSEISEPLWDELALLLRQAPPYLIVLRVRPIHPFERVLGFFIWRETPSWHIDVPPNTLPGSFDPGPESRFRPGSLDGLPSCRAGDEQSDLVELPAGWIGQSPIDGAKWRLGPHQP